MLLTKISLTSSVSRSPSLQFFVRSSWISSSDSQSFCRRPKKLYLSWVRFVVAVTLVFSNSQNSQTLCQRFVFHGFCKRSIFGLLFRVAIIIAISAYYSCLSFVISCVCGVFVFPPSQFFVVDLSRLFISFIFFRPTGCVVGCFRYFWNWKGYFGPK